jgi:hypothetical protein
LVAGIVHQAFGLRQEILLDGFGEISQPSGRAASVRETDRLPDATQRALIQFSRFEEVF